MNSIHGIYSYLLLGLGAFRLIEAWLRVARPHQGLLFASIAGVCLQAAGNVPANYPYSPLPGLDLTPFVFSLIGFLAAMCLFHFQLLRIVPVAHETVFACMKKGASVLDDQDRVIDQNPAAKRLIGRSVLEIVGRPIGQVTGPPSPSRMHWRRYRATKAFSISRGLGALCRSVCAAGLPVLLVGDGFLPIAFG